MASVHDDPLAPNLLPSRPAAMSTSADVPSAGAIRPFGLTRLTVLKDGEAMVSLDGATYDPTRQLNVDPTGRPFVDAPGTIHAETNTDTQFDMTWVVDKD